MPHFDLDLEQLHRYRSTVTRPEDFEESWGRRLKHARELAVEPRYMPYLPEVYAAVAVDDVTFSGAEGHPVRAWYLRPRQADPPLPCLVTYPGYGEGRGLPVEHCLYPAAGFATFVMDVRGQGGWHGVGSTGDPGGWPGPEHPGVMTRGLTDPDRYYYRRLYVDAVRAVETVREHPEIDPERIGVAGSSQGGALALAAAAFAPESVRFCQADMPFLCDIRRGLSLSSTLPYREVVEFLAQHVDLVADAHHTLSYVDCVNLAPRIRSRCSLSVGLMDETCPPSTVFGAYNALSAPKQMEILEYAAHTVPARRLERRLAEFNAAVATQAPTLRSRRRPATGSSSHRRHRPPDP